MGKLVSIGLRLFAIESVVLSIATIRLVSAQKEATFAVVAVALFRTSKAVLLLAPSACCFIYTMLLAAVSPD